MDAILPDLPIEDRSPRSRPWLMHGLAAAVYTIVSLWTLRAVLPAPATLFPQREAVRGQPAGALAASDQRFVAWGVARNAHRLLTGRWHMFAGDSCFPTPESVAFGEHMLGTGLLGVVPWALTGDPILATNAVVILTFWLAAVAMYALAYYWTGSGPAAMVGGLLFGFQAVRVSDPEHPFVHGNHWVPLVLLFAHRAFEPGRLRDAFGLAGFLALELLESFYQVFATAVLGAVYGAVLLVRYRRKLPVLLPRLALAALPLGALAVLVFAPYLSVGRVWGGLEREAILPYPATFYLGNPSYPGTVLLVLAGLGIIDRLVRRRRPIDPRLPLLMAGGLLAWSSVMGIVVPGLGFLPSPLLAIRELVPGLTAVRGLANLREALYVALAFAGAFGVLLLIERRRPALQAGVAALAGAAALLEVLHGPFAARSFGASRTLGAWNVRPPEVQVRLAREQAHGPVLDLPLRRDLYGRLVLMSSYLLWGGFHLQPTAACATSFTPPVVDDVVRLAGLLPEPGAADALHALGFRTVAVHYDLEAPADRAALVEEVGRLVAAGRLVPAGGDDALALFHLRPGRPVADDPRLLATSPGALAADVTLSPDGQLPVRLRNGGTEVYRQADPIAPIAVAVRWRDGDDRVTSTASRLFLPLALLPGEAIERTIRVVPPAGGDYTVEVVPAMHPDLVLARVRVHLASEPPLGY